MTRYQHPVAYWLRCGQPPLAESVALRMDTWVAGLSNQVFKALYDAVWVASGGVVDTATYRNALASMSSTIETVLTPDGVPIEIVTTPQLTLIRATNAFLDNFPVPQPCSYRPVEFDR